MEHLNAMEIMLIANKAYIRGQLMKLNKIQLVDPMISHAEQHIKECLPCKRKTQIPNKPIHISNEDWLHYLG